MFGLVDIIKCKTSLAFANNNLGFIGLDSPLLLDC